MFYSEKSFKTALAKETKDLNEQITTLSGERNTAIQQEDTLQTANDNLTSERDAAIQQRDNLQAELDGSSSNDDATQSMNETFNSLDELDESVQNAETPEAKTTAVVELVSTLRQTSGAQSSTIISKKESKSANSEKDENVTSEKKSFSENLEAVTKDLL